MRTVFHQAECQNLKTALGKEWLETNGLGGFACSTIIGAHVRRQSGWLIASLRPPVERHVLLSKLEDRVVVDGQDFYLSTNLYPGTVYPHGFNIQSEFRLRPWPQFRYVGPGFEVERHLCLIHGQNTVVISYANTGKTGPLQIKARPLLAFREYNTLRRRHDDVNFDVRSSPGEWSVQPCQDLPRLYFRGAPAAVEIKADWYHRLQYPIEQERGLDFEEDLFTPLEFTFRLRRGETTHLLVTLEPNVTDPAALLEAERARRRAYDKEPDPIRRALLMAADAFIVRRGKQHTTVLAGYPWFTDWGRDTMIALPGLTLTNGRFDTARQILLSFAHYCDRGMIPNVFPDVGEAPEYNTVDASLWFIVAAWRYWKASGDDATARQLLPALADVIRHYREGTRYEIRCDTDGLVSAGTAGSQLTWMDVKVDGYVPTPRHGKPVEINALWLNALLMVAEMEERLANNVHGAVILRKLADQVTVSFSKTFWHAEGGYLYDVVRDDVRDPSIRPNQIFAISLPHSPLTDAQQRSVFDVVTKHLLTPYGLRSLTRHHEKYCGRYGGNRWQRDCAYHQGTVWAWLIGPYCDAYARLHGTGKAQRKELAGLLTGLIAHLEEHGLGSIAEIFDGDPPHRPNGCIAQAWSVAELLRVYDTYVR